MPAAATPSRHARALRTLVNKAMNNGDTPLFVACDKDHTEIAATLIALRTPT